VTTRESGTPKLMESITVGYSALNKTMSILNYKQKKIISTGRKAKRFQAGHQSYLVASESIPRSDEFLLIFLEV
jgi:hypothetical protein